MISWEFISYKILLFLRLIQIPFLTGHRPTDEYARLVESYLTYPRARSIDQSSIFPNNIQGNLTLITRTHLLPMITGELSSLIFTVFGIYTRAHSLLSPLLSPFLILRLLSFVFSLLIDYLIFRIARFWRIKPNLTLFLYSSSYLPWTFFTFGRSCLIESIMFVLFLYLVITSIAFAGEGHSHQHDKGGGGQRSINQQHGHSHFHGMCVEDEDDAQDDAFKLMKRSLTLGFVFSMGVSNRLNFVVFALAPLVQWFLSSDYKHLERSFCSLFVRKLFNFLLGALLGFLSIGLIDSLVIGSLKIDPSTAARDFDELRIPSATEFIRLLRNNFTFASLNSLKVVLTFKSLTNQSLHPWYSHIFINTPLVFGIFGILTFIYFAQCFRLEVLTRLHYINARYWFLLSTFVVPLISLSIYPPKDAEDLCPLLIPLILIVVIRISQYNFKSQARLISIWIVWNSFGVLYYGLLFNGGLYECVNGLERSRIFIRTKFPAQNRSFAYHFYATIDRPSSMEFLNERSISHHDSDFGRMDSNNNVSPRIFVYRSNERAKFRRRLKWSTEKFTDVFVIIPSTISTCDLWTKDEYTNVALVQKYYWHFSPEAPPSPWQIIGCKIDAEEEVDVDDNRSKEKSQCKAICSENKWKQLYQLMTLRVYRF